MIVLLAIGVAACGDQPLANVGDITNNWVGETNATVEEGGAAASSAPAMTSFPDIHWANGELRATSSASTAEVLRTAWERRNKGDRFVQAGPSEIAVAVPGILFPSEVAVEIEWISSQLLLSNGQLDSEHWAVFGFWNVEPYTRSRQSGQAAVLWVSESHATDCEREIVPGDQCHPVKIGHHDGIQLTGGSRTILIWADGMFGYELFYRPSISDAAAFLMAQSFTPLSRLIDDGEVVAGETAVVSRNSG